MKSLFLGLTFISSLVLAETATVTVEGLHCSGCKHEIREKVCDAASMKSNYESCSVEFSDKKKQIGQIKITTKKDAKIDLVVVKASVKAAGDEFKVTKEEVK